MKQSFIILGEGLTDLFEFLTLIEYNHARIDKVVFPYTTVRQTLIISRNYYESYDR